MQKWETQQAGVSKQHEMAEHLAYQRANMVKIVCIDGFIRYAESFAP